MSNADANQEAPSPVPVPPEFAFTWEDPADERLFWHADKMHFPEPVTPMMLGFNRTFKEGWRRAAEACSVPIQLEYRRINTYNFNAVSPRVPPEEMEAVGKASQDILGPMMGRLWESWETELLPEVQEHLAFWEDFDLRGASMPDLLSHLDETWDRLTRLWDIHFLVAFPFLLAPSLFGELYQDLFGEESALDASRLSQGLGNKTVEGDHALWDLSRKALASPEVRRILEGNDPAGVTDALAGSSESQAFLSDFREYLEEYGQRSDIFGEMGDPHWIENPVTPIKNLQDYLKQPDRDLRGELETLSAERERRVAEARERLKGYPGPVVEQFEFLLKATRAGTVLQEDHNHWIDQRGTYKARRVLREFGRRLAESGVIQETDDVFSLTPDELRESASSLPGGDRRQLVIERKAEMDRFRAIQQQPALGTPPPGPPPDDPLGRAVGKFFGLPPAESSDPDLLPGNASSSGKATGTAKVVLSLADAGKVQRGDILVAPATMPSWPESTTSPPSSARAKQRR